MSPHGDKLPSFPGPKASKGERREAGIQWIQPPKAVSDPEFRQTTSGAHGSANRADCLPRGKPFGAPAGAGLLPVGSDAPTTAREHGRRYPMGKFCPPSGPEGFQRASGKSFGAPAGAKPFSCRGIDAPTPARVMGLPPRRGIVLSFGAKESTKESKRHGDSCGPPRYASRASVCGSPFGAVLDLGSLRSPFREKGFYCPF